MEALATRGEPVAPPGPVEARCFRFEDGRGDAVEVGGSICDCWLNCCEDEDEAEGFCCCWLYMEGEAAPMKGVALGGWERLE